MTAPNVLVFDLLAPRHGDQVHKTEDLVSLY